MISISSPTYDPNGHIRIDAEPDNSYSAARRSTITATLDGGVSAYDGGYAKADHSINFTMRDVRKNEAVQIEYLIAHYPVLLVCCHAGAYRCIVSVANDKTTSRVTCRIIEEVS